MTDTLTALIGKWRSEAELNDWDAAHALTRCADELEATLTASPVGDERVRAYVQHKFDCDGGRPCGACGYYDAASAQCDSHQRGPCSCGLDAMLTAAPVQADKETR
jgi:hypothetical protein